MELINLDGLTQLIRKITQPIVREELAKRGEAIDQKMFSRKDAYRYLGISGSFFDSIVNQGFIKPTLPGNGRTRYYLREDLDKFAEDGKEYLKRTRK